MSYSAVRNIADTMCAGQFDLSLFSDYIVSGVVS
jgi:hypothetical protein